MIDRHLKKIPEKHVGTFIIILAFLIFIIINTLMRPVFDFSLDTTDNRKNTLSNDIISLLQSIQEPITVKIYYSPMLASLSSDYKRIFDKLAFTLKQYRDKSADRLNVEVYLVDPFSDEYMQAKDYGLKAIPIEKNVSSGFFGIVMTDALGRREIVPVITPGLRMNMNYTLGKLLLTFLNPEKPNIMIMSDFDLSGDVVVSLDMGTKDIPSWAIISVLKEFYNVYFAPSTFFYIPDVVNVLIVTSPLEIDELTAYAIEQYLIRGGKMILLLDPFSEIARLKELPPYRDGTPLDKLTSTLGISLEPGKVIADSAIARAINLTRDYGVISSYNILWLELGKEQMAATSPVTSSLYAMSIPSAGALRLSQKDDLLSEILIRSTPQAMLMDRKELVNQTQPETLSEKFNPGNKPLTVAARIRGSFKSAYNGPPEANLKIVKDALPEYIAASTAPTDIIVVSDTDFIYDYFWNSTVDASDATTPILLPYRDNADFILNTLDSMIGSQFLSTARKNSFAYHPFTVIDRKITALKMKTYKKNAELFREGEAAVTLLKEIQAAIKQSGKAVTIEQTQYIQDLKSVIEDISLAINRNNLSMQRQLSSYLSRIVLINAFLVPTLILLWLIIITITRKKNA